MIHAFRIKNPAPTLQFLAGLSLSLLLGLFWFLVLYGPYPLDLSHVDWFYLHRGDNIQHQIGWEWFRQVPWGFPLGRIPDYGYPFGTYMALLDPIPLMAILFKLLSPWLGAQVQYFGVWELLSIVAMIWVSLQILGRFTDSLPYRILGASLLVLSPPMINRTFTHDSLAGQWLLLAGIWLVLLEYRGEARRWAWFPLLGVAVLINQYLVAMLMPLFLISLFYRYRVTRRWGALLVDMLAAVVLILAILYSLGIFSLGLHELGLTYGFYSWNLDGLINPHSYSAFLKQLPFGTEGQYEGFSYLGLGNLLLLVPAVILALKQGRLLKQPEVLVPFGLATLLYMTFALSNRAYWGSHLLWNIPLPDALYRLFSLFHSSGRFIWPVFYFIVLFFLVTLARHPRLASLVLLVAVVIQFVDIQPLIRSKKFLGDARYQSPLQSEFWVQAGRSERHLVLLPSSWEAGEPVYEPFVMYARQNELTLNFGFFARADYMAIMDYGNQVWEGLLAGQSDDRTVYILSDPQWIEVARSQLADRMLTCQVDGYFILLSPGNPLVQTYGPIAEVCTIP